MRNMYLLLTATLIVIVTLVAFTFLYLEKEKHQSYLYVVEIGGEEVGFVKIDRYKTEDSVIYKSTQFSPGDMNCKIVHEKFVFSRDGFKLDSFSKECKNFGAIIDTVSIKRGDFQGFDFLAKSGSKFGTVSDLTRVKSISVFDSASIVTYMPFIDMYNFSMGGAQSFNALYRFLNLLPPATGKVIFRSIKDEYINLTGKKIKTENIRVWAKKIPESYIWVSKHDKSIVRLTVKSKSLVIKRVGFLKKFDFSEYASTDKNYESQEVIFPSGDIALSGTLSIPQGKKAMPSILLVAENSPYNRENAGLFTDTANAFAKNGYAVLRFDNRGIGESQGDNASTSLTDELQDIESALNFLLNHERVNRDKVFIVAHRDACSYLPQINFTKYPVKGFIMLGITKPSFLVDFESEYVSDKVKQMSEIDKKYHDTLDTLKKETLILVGETKKDYATILGNRVFVKNMAEIMAFKPLEGFKAFRIPLMIIQGKKDNLVSLGYTRDIEEMLGKEGFEHFSTLSFRGLGGFFGESVREKNIAEHYVVNKEVLETMVGWVNAKCRDATSEVREDISEPVGLTNE